MRAFLATLALVRLPRRTLAALVGAALAGAIHAAQAQGVSARDVASAWPSQRAVAGIGSWYGPAHHGRRTASGERFDMNGLTCAHRAYPFGTRLRVTYRERSVICRVNDRGPFIKGRVVDLSRAAARAIALPGIGTVTIERM